MIGKKIGIITYWESNDNYGQQLQCWALQYYLRKQGHRPFLIRFKRWHPRLSLKTRIKRIVKKIVVGFLFKTGLIKCGNLYQKIDGWTDKEIYRRQFPSFRKRFIRHSCRVYENLNQLQKHAPRASVYITGSDQVWNFDLREDELRAYFLQFGSKVVKRIAYAPSIGHDQIPQAYRDTYRLFLHRFDAISVREISNVSSINSLGYNAIGVLDPTMLLIDSDYSRFLKGVSARPSVYIYSINYSSSDDLPFDKVQEYAREKDLPIVVTPGSGFLRAKELFDGVIYLYATIPQWIAQIANAELVVTASFHGIIFSILFHRSFVYTPLKGKFSSSNNRIYDLLKALNLEDRILKDTSSFFYPLEKEINWEDVDFRLNSLRKNSFRFLNNALM